MMENSELRDIAREILAKTSVESKRLIVAKSRDGFVNQIGRWLRGLPQDGMWPIG